jgi:hypothetical protein
VPTNGDFRQSVPCVCAACVCGGTVVSTAELVGTELLRANLSALVGPSVCAK